MGLISQSLNFMSCLKRQEIATPLHIDIAFEHIVKIGSGLDHLMKFVTSKIQIDLNLDMHSKVKTFVVLKGLKKLELRKQLLKVISNLRIFKSSDSPKVFKKHNCHAITVNINIKLFNTLIFQKRHKKFKYCYQHKSKFLRKVEYLLFRKCLHFQLLEQGCLCFSPFCLFCK